MDSDEPAGVFVIHESADQGEDLVHEHFAFAICSSLNCGRF